MKACAKCDGPIPSPVLGDEIDERCPLCGDEPPSCADLAGLLRTSLPALSRVRDELVRACDVEPEYQLAGIFDALTALERGFEDLDSAIRSLEDEDEACPHDPDGVHFVGCGCDQ